MAGQELGTSLEIKNSEVQRQEPCACAVGTSISMKNLFFSVPARRHFLKSNATEMRHIVDEFLHVALAYPAITFILEANGTEMFHLLATSVKQRIMQVLGGQYNERLVSVKENTDYLDVSGFVGKPETARKTRGEQYFFVNSRYIRSPYLHHAVMTAFNDLIPADSHPMYVLFIELDPARVDINVHPTKQEIKFEDERLIYAFIQSAVKHALARYSITPSLDFGLDAAIEDLPSISQPFTDKQKEETAATDIFQTFTQKYQAHAISSGRRFPGTPVTAEPPFPSMPAAETGMAAEEGKTILHEEASAGDGEENPQKPPQQIHGRYILQQIKSGFILIDQQAAHERVLYERYCRAFSKSALPSQQSLFPEKLTLPAADALLLTEMLSELRTLGYEVQPAEPGSFVVQGTPADLETADERGSLESLLEQFKHFSAELKMDRREKMIRSMAVQHALKPGRILQAAEMQNLIDQLFACTEPQTTPGGYHTFIIFRMDELAKLFGR
jgi:DNA mismatch repair protein MutL